QDLERHPVARLDAPARGRTLADLLDDAQWLVPRDDGRLASTPGVPVLLDVAAADAAGLDPQQAVIGPGPRAGKLTELDLARSHLDRRANHLGHDRPPSRGIGGRGPALSSDGV